MSFIQSARCVRLKCPGVAKNVLLALADMANDAGYAWPTIETLCMRTDWGKRAVIDAIAWLEAHRAIRPDRTNGRKTVYWITPDSFTGDRHPDPAEKQRNQCATRTGAPDAPVHVAHGTGAPHAPNRCAKRTLTIKNHQEPEKDPLPPEGGESVDNLKARERAPQSDAFEAIAAGYPRRAGIGAARRDWERLNPDEQQQGAIARAIKAWTTSDEWQRDGGRWIPKFGKWLRDERWLDAPGTAAPPPPPVATPAPRALTPEQMQANKQRATELAALARAAVGSRRRQAAESVPA